MRTSEELYGKLPKYIKSMQKIVVEAKIKGAKKQLDILQEVELFTRDDKLINDIIKTIEHNKQLLEEMK